MLPLLKNQYKCMMKAFQEQYSEEKFTFTDIVRHKLGQNPVTFPANHVGVKEKTEEMKEELGKL